MKRRTTTTRGARNRAASGGGGRRTAARQRQPHGGRGPTTTTFGRLAVASGGADYRGRAPTRRPAATPARGRARGGGRPVAAIALVALNGRPSRGSVLAASWRSRASRSCACEKHSAPPPRVDPRDGQRSSGVGGKRERGSKQGSRCCVRVHACSAARGTRLERRQARAQRAVMKAWRDGRRSGTVVYAARGRVNE